MSIVNAALLYGVFAFSEEDIWVTSGVLIHWDGQDWEIYNLWELGILIEGDGLPVTIWGTSTSNILLLDGMV